MQRLDYWERVRDIPAEKLVFIDETAFWVGMSRRFARSERGLRAFFLRSFYKGKKMTLIGAMRIEGIVATRMVQRSMKGKDFREYLESDLVPKLQKGDVVVMDNLRIHRMRGIEEIVKKVGAKIEYLPTYSPDFNPIEMLWSKVKAFVREYPTREIKAVEKLVEIGLSLTGGSCFRNWFAKCCYCTS
jgi:transposase